MCASNKLPWDSHAAFPSLSFELLDSSVIPCKLMMLLFKATGNPLKTGPRSRTWDGQARSTPREAPRSLSILLVHSATAGDRLGLVNFH